MDFSIFIIGNYIFFRNFAPRKGTTQHKKEKRTKKMSNNNSFVGSKIKGIRETKNLSIEEIAESSGLSAEQILSIENGQNMPSLGPLIKIARALGVRLGTFMDDTCRRSRTR